MPRPNDLARIAIVLSLGLLLPGPAGAWPCSVRAKHGTPRRELAAMAKVTEESARTSALARLGSSGKPHVLEAELELERGCVVYSFDVREAGRAGVTEVIVDAGTGKVLSQQHESPKAEEAERQKESGGRPARPARAKPLLPKEGR